MTRYTIRLHFGDGTDLDGIFGFMDAVITANDKDAAIDIANRLYPRAEKYEVRENVG